MEENAKRVHTKAGLIIIRNFQKNMKNKMIFFNVHEKSEGNEWQREEQRLAGSLVHVLRVAVDKRTDLPNSGCVLSVVGMTAAYSYLEG